MLPFHPQPIEVMKKRYHRAMKRVYTVADAEKGECAGICPDNVFDFEDDTRIVVTKERILSDLPQIHVSATPAQGSKTALRIKDLESMVDFMDVARRHFAEISGETRSLDFSGFSAIGTPHWYLPCGTAG